MPRLGTPRPFSLQPPRSSTTPAGCLPGWRGQRILTVQSVLYGCKSRKQTQPDSNDNAVTRGSLDGSRLCERGW